MGTALRHSVTVLLSRMASERASCSPIISSLVALLIWLRSIMARKLGAAIMAKMATMPTTTMTSIRVTPRTRRRRRAKVLMLLS